MNDNLSKPEAYDLVVLGSGEGGKYIAWTLAKQGKRVAMIGGMLYTALDDDIFIHPTLLVGLIALFSSVPPMSCLIGQRGAKKNAMKEHAQ
jgi:hypothetical protein